MAAAVEVVHVTCLGPRRCAHVPEARRARGVLRETGGLRPPGQSSFVLLDDARRTCMLYVCATRFLGGGACRQWRCCWHAACPGRSRTSRSAPSPKRSDCCCKQSMMRFAVVPNAHVSTVITINGFEGLACPASCTGIPYPQRFGQTPNGRPAMHACCHLPPSQAHRRCQCNNVHAGVSPPAHPPAQLLPG